jgi:hypothetical protein
VHLTAIDVHAARRELAKRSVADFACMVDIPTVPLMGIEDADDFSVMRLDTLADHHALILNKLQAVEEKSIDNLMLMLPPGSAKSTYADVVFIPWFMAKRGRRNVILASYASDIAKKQGRRARQLIKSDSFQNLMRLGIMSDQSAADQWALDNGSEYMAGGLLSGLTGNRAHLGVVDDPIAGREAAQSQTIRDKTWDAYIDDFCSRLIPGAPQILIMTRWHEDDIAGRILPDKWRGESGSFEGRDGRNWDVVCLPAICDRVDDPLGREIGATLWPEWFSDKHWEPFKRNHRTWTSLYQQKPTAEEGTYFKRDAFTRFEERDIPNAIRYYMTSDYAVTEDGGDYTVLTVWGVDSAVPANVYRIDSWRGQTSSDKWIEAQCDLIARWRPLVAYGEAGVIQKAIEPMLRAKLRDRRLSARLEWLPSMTDKPTRARSAQGLTEEGRIYVRDDHDGDCFIDECVAFPAGKNDDEVDNLSLIGRAIGKIVPTVHKRKPRPEPSQMSWAA